MNGGGAIVDHSQQEKLREVNRLTHLRGGLTLLLNREKMERIRISKSIRKKVVIQINKA